MSRKNYKRICAFYLGYTIGFLILAIGDRAAYPDSFWFFFMMVAAIIGPTVLFLYDQLIKLQEEVESLKEQIGSKASSGSDN